MKKILCAIALAMACAMPAAAHHGKDFLIVEGYELPHPHTIYFVTSEMFARHTFTDEPSLFFGFSDRWAGEVHVHVSRDGYEAIAPAVHVQFGALEKWSFAGSAEYEFARHSEDNAFAARVVAARAIGEGSLVINVGNRGAYAIGYRPDMEAHTSWGIEAGREERGEDHEVLFGIYTQPTERFTFKAGVGAGFGNGRTTLVVRTGLVWRF